ncbi:MAG: hypothetical protein KY469_22650 [Actinobacteria bacterium]|nr:hypothetical protein [Actinomycetota bacterium]
MAEAVEQDPSSHHTRHGQAVRAGLDGDADRGPLVAVPIDGDDGSRVVAAALYDDRGDPGDVAAWQVDRSWAVTAANELAGTISRFEVQVIDAAGSDGPAQALALATDCSWGAASRLRPRPPEPAPSMRPDLLVLQPATARPGEFVAMHFPQVTMRGVAFQLDRRTELGWETVYWLTSDGNGGKPTSIRVGSEGNYGWPDVGVDGPGPDRVLIPHGIEPGRYRLCTANAGDEFCAPLDIVG